MLFPTAAIYCNETKTLFRVEPLNCSRCHLANLPGRRGHAAIASCQSSSKSVTETSQPGALAQGRS